MSGTDPAAGIAALLDIMAQLRDPERGCAWDRAQDFASIAPYTLEEAGEVVDAIDRRDWAALREELGDLLLQVVFHARMAEERGLFAFADVVQAISDKLVRRHPQVFAAPAPLDAAGQQRLWEQIKAEERAARGEPEDASALAGVSRGQPSWRRAAKLQQRAAGSGFRWPDTGPVLDKLQEELDEVRAAIAAAEPAARVEDEIGDMLFVLVNLCRHTGTGFDRALRGANRKFERRFCAMEAAARAAGTTLEQLPLARQEALWQAAKRAEG